MEQIAFDIEDVSKCFAAHVEDSPKIEALPFRESMGGGCLATRVQTGLEPGDINPYDAEWLKAKREEDEEYVLYLKSLSPDGIPLANKTHSELRALQSPFKWTVHGHPVLPRSQVSEVGKWAGVAVVSKCPSRPLVHHWDPAQYATGRLVAATSFCRGLWISGIGVYCPPVGPTHHNAKLTTEHLLTLAVERIQQSVGCRYVAGDWNSDHMSLQSIAKLRSLGFVDLQELQYQAWGNHPQPTCRGKTRRDYLYVSPELAARFVCCRVDSLAWTDHASLVGEFKSDDALDLKFVWPIPSKLAWDTQCCCSAVDFESADDLNVAYRQFWKQREDAAVRAARVSGRPVLPNALGRGLHHKPKTCRSSVAPIRVGRTGEVQPKFLGYSVLHVHWFKQLRRLQSLARVSSVHSPSETHCAHSQALWEAILKAPGFQPSFKEWWSSQIHEQGSSGMLPLQCPSGDFVWGMFLFFQAEVTKLEKALVKHKNYAARLKQTGDIAHLYRKVRRDAPEQVDVLFHEVSQPVATVDLENCAVEFDNHGNWTHDKPVFHQGRRLQVHHAEADKLWLSSVEQVEVGDVIAQPQSRGTLSDLFQAFADQWKNRWIRHAHVPSERWDVIIAFAQRYLKPVQAPPLDFTPALLRAVAHSKKRLAATGLDGVSRHDVLNLDLNGLASICSIFKNACSTGKWPQQILNGAVKSLAKREAPSHPNHFRPVTIFSIIYRCWSSAESRYWLTLLDDVLDPMLLGNRKGKSASTVWRRLMDHLEESAIEDQTASGLIFDLENAYNTLPRKPALAAAHLLGLPFPVIRAWTGALSSMSRHFYIRGSYSPGMMADCGFPEGCGLSCLSMVAIDQLLHLWISKSQEMARAVTYVDNWELLVSDPNAIRSAYDRVCEFTDLLDLTLDAAKTIAWSNNRATRRQFRQQGFQVDLAVRELGAQITFSQQIRNATLLNRVHKLADFWDKLKVSGGSFSQKLRLVYTAAWPRAFHGVSSCCIGKKHWVPIRTSFLRAMWLDKPGASSWLQMAQARVGFDPQAYAIIQTVREDYRIAAWSVILSPNPYVDSVAWSTKILAAGPLTGIVQSAHRAELFALVAAVELTQQFGGVIRIWTDCLSVVNGFQKYIVGKRPVPANHKHADLWRRLVTAVNCFPAGRVMVGKVPAHEDVASAETELERWAMIGNHAADRAAASANFSRGDDFWNLWRDHVRALVNFEETSQLIRDHMVAVSEQWQASAQPEVVRGTPVHRPRPVVALQWEPHETLQHCRGEFAKLFPTISEQFLQWWQTGIDNVGSEVQWVSYCQLYIDWQLQKGHPGMIRISNRWVDPVSCGGCAPEIYHFKLRMKWWRLCVQQFIKSHDIQTKWLTGRPKSAMLQCFIGCVSIPWSNQRLQAVESWLRQHLRSPALGQGQSLAELPLAHGL
eukprot:symbB.v1.2.016628.t2/scaffold1241.1/size129723/3